MATIRRRRRRARVVVLVGAMLVAAVALGVTAGSLNAPTGTAAREPAVIGFVPEQEWFALQSPPPAVPGQQTAAVAANVPFAADDVVHGLVEPSGLPYSTLLTLPPRGIVLVATMTPETAPHLAPIPTNPVYPKVELPLRVRDGVPWVQWGAQVRPDQPLAQYQLRASIRDYNVDVFVYFGTSRPSKSQLDAAQRQLEGLVVRSQQSASAPVGVRAADDAAALAVIDRTYVCSTSILGGIYELKSRAHAGIRSGSGWAKLPWAGASSGGWAGPLTGLPNAPGNTLAWITAGAPSSSTTVGADGEVFPVLGGGTIGVNSSMCRPSNAKVALSPSGLRGGSAPPEVVSLECVAPRRLLIRLRASAEGSSALRERARLFLATNAPAREAKLVVRTPAGKLLSYADVSDSGKARLFTAKGCSRE
ncbi:MAG TPA: hypothetical protein VFN06_06045 [Gaiellaceae bacterium]|nr:hypothetical protein [Gaiellaceae bacterium]